MAVRDGQVVDLWWADLRSAANKVGVGEIFPEREQGMVQDDHTPFVRRGIPAVDLIDFTFRCWHKTCDDMSAVSERSLDLSGETVLEPLGQLQDGPIRGAVSAAVEMGGDRRAVAPRRDRQGAGHGDRLCAGRRGGEGV